MELVKKIIVIYLVFVVTLLWILYQEWIPSIKEFINILIVVIYLIVAGIAIFILFQRTLLRLKITTLISTIIILIPVLISILPFSFDKKFIKRIDDFYFYSVEAFPDSGNNLYVYKRNQNLPTMKKFFLKRTFNMGDSILIFKEDKNIYIRKTFRNDNSFYCLDINSHEIIPIKK